MEISSVVNKVKAKINVKIAEGMTFESKKVGIDDFKAVFLPEMLKVLKKEWGLAKINDRDLDISFKPVALKWGVSFPRSSGVLNIRLNVPDQKVSIEIDATYTDDSEKDYDHSFSLDVSLKDVIVDDSKINFKGDISPSMLKHTGEGFEVEFND